MVHKVLLSVNRHSTSCARVCNARRSVSFSRSVIEMISWVKTAKLRLASDCRGVDAHAVERLERLSERNREIGEAAVAVEAGEWAKPCEGSKDGLLASWKKRQNRTGERRLEAAPVVGLSSDAWPVALAKLAATRQLE